jgi:hypothetical protein
MQPDLQLENEELELFNQIVWEAQKLSDHIAYKANAERVERFFSLIAERSIVPEHRMLYFTDPSYNVGGRGKSRKGIFERNGCYGVDIVRHAHFLPYLQYMVCGPGLPQGAIVQFKKKVDELGPITSGDIIPLRDCARMIARQCLDTPKNFADQFFQLALDCGLSTGYASIVRRGVQQIRK